MSVDGALPEQSEAQRIGGLAKTCFIANRPEDWLFTELAGDEDFGFDYQIQVMENSHATHVFRAQLKGTTSPDLSSAKDFYSIQLKASTVRYYLKCNEPILLVLADLSSGEKSKDCPLYFAWIHDELRRLKSEEMAYDQKYTSFRILTANQLTDTTNLSVELERCRRIGKVGDDLDMVVDRQNPGMSSVSRMDMIERIPNHLARISPSLLTVISEDPITAWPTAPKGSLAWHLNEATAQLRLGNATEAGEHLDLANALLENSAVLEQADYMFTKGQLHAFHLDDELAIEAYAKAVELSGGLSRHLVAWAEAQLRFRFSIDGNNDFSDVIARLVGTDVSSIGMRARLLAASGKYELALETAKQAHGSESWVAQAIIQTMRAEWALVLEACETGLADQHLRDNSKLLFHILRARALFSLAIGTLSYTAPETEIPPTGPVGTDLSMLRKAWPEICLSVDSLRKSGWPFNVSLITDIWVSATLILGKQHDVLPLLKDAADTRPNMPSLQLALETIAFHVSDYSLALMANARQPETDVQVIRRVVLLHLAGKHAECVELFRSKGISVSPSDSMFGTAITQAILSAERIVRTDLVKEWESKFIAEHELAVPYALFEFWRTKQKNLLAVDKALEQLEIAYSTLGKPFLLGIQLFMELDATDKAQAEKIIALVVDITKERMLPTDAVLHLAQALSTIDDWDGLLKLSKDALARYDDNERFIAMEALALDRLGRSTDALASLKKLLATGSMDQFALNTYIGIVVRCGLIDDAIRTVESIVAAETDHAKNIEALRLLFKLIQHSDPQSSRAFEVAWRIGQLAKQDDEEQEGLFVMLMMAATLHFTLDNTDSRVPEFIRRRQAFMERFPHSKIMRAVQFPENASPDELIKILRDVTGINDEQVKWYEKMERQLQRGEIPIPYAWRPHFVLCNVPDIPTLWAIGKNSKPHERQYHLTMAIDGQHPVPFTQITNTTPILDLVTLFVVMDLGILDLLFDLFTNIAIDQATLNQLFQLTAPVVGSPLRNECLALQNNLKGHLEQIFQPWADLPDELPQRVHDWPMEEVKRLVAKGSYALYSDDAIFRVYCEIPNMAPPCFCTLDVLKALEDKGKLSAYEVAEKISKLCEWHVGLIIDLKYQVEILPLELGNMRTVGEGVDVLRKSTACMAIFDSIWDPNKSFESLMGHAIAIFREFTSSSINRVESIASVLGLWFGKAKLHKDSPYPPERLLALLLISTAGNCPAVSAEISRMLWNVYRHLIEFQHAERMDECKEREAIALAGEIAAELDHNNNFTGEQSLRNRLALGITADTSDAEAFNGGYNKYTSVIVQAEKQR